ncbi:hypothetical protein Mnod_6207 [Methylobacterium nodulans ORS 2060]|uniref:Uncharacterized protein n=1 Tax=Methylobacterium nodulans (strain LMG 21967 / CNCM I-2342 / ORS 2060) TaxID=460265 RepID=B8IVG4_METNO|nr:hypothetical protein Mnod_6207 [Methylobacterium nodulans ORS 2060]
MRSTTVRDSVWDDAAHVLRKKIITVCREALTHRSVTRCNILCTSFRISTSCRSLKLLLAVQAARFVDGCKRVNQYIPPPPPAGRYPNPFRGRPRATSSSQEILRPLLQSTLRHGCKAFWKPSATRMVRGWRRARLSSPSSATPTRRNSDRRRAIWPHSRRARSTPSPSTNVRRRSDGTSSPRRRSSSRRRRRSIRRTLQWSKCRPASTWPTSISATRRCWRRSTASSPITRWMSVHSSALAARQSSRRSCVWIRSTSTSTAARSRCFSSCDRSPSRAGR